MISGRDEPHSSGVRFAVATIRSEAVGAVVRRAEDPWMQSVSAQGMRHKYIIVRVRR